MIVDADVLVALHRPNHTHHERAKRAAKTGTLMATRGTLIEMTAVLRRLAKDEGRDGNQDARTMLRALRAHPAYRPACDVPEDDVAALYDSHSALSFADAWTIAASKACQEPLLSFDRDLCRIGKQAGVDLHSESA